jgi:3-oxoacyl-[acyl-carrier-protein] synthase III
MGCLLAVDKAAGVAGAGIATTARRAAGAETDGRLDRLPRLTQLAVQAAREALAAAPRGDESHTAVVAATRHGAATSMAEFVAGFRARGQSRGDPFIFPNVLYNAMAGEVAIRAGLRGHNVTLTAGDVCGAGSLEIALLLLGTGRARRVLVLSVEDGGEMVQRAYDGLRRRGLAGTGPVSKLRPMTEDVAVAWLLDPRAAGSLAIRRAVTGHAETDAEFADFVDRARAGLDVDSVVTLDATRSAHLGRFVEAAAALRAGTHSLVVHRGDEGGCGAVIFES